MTNIVLITNGSRPRLLEQTLSTLYKNTPRDQFNLTIVDESNLLWPFQGHLDLAENWNLLRIEPPCNIVGRLKNLGIVWSRKVFGEGEWLLCIDDDIAFLPNWLEQTARAKQITRTEDGDKGFAIIGGYRHPFHGVNKKCPSFDPNWRTYIEETDAVAGYSHFMRWATYDRYGPYDENAKGVCQSEDFSFCRRVISGGGHVGYIDPSVIVNCGITNSEGKPAIGGDQFPRVKGLIYE